MSPEVMHDNHKASPMPYILIFERRSSLNIKRVMTILKFDLFF